MLPTNHRNSRSPHHPDRPLRGKGGDAIHSGGDKLSRQRDCPICGGTNIVRREYLCKYPSHRTKRRHCKSGTMHAQTKASLYCQRCGLKRTWWMKTKKGGGK